MGWWSNFTKKSNIAEDGEMRKPSKKETMAMAAAKKNADASAEKDNDFARSCQSKNWAEAQAKLGAGASGRGVSSGHSALFWAARGGPAELAKAIMADHDEAFEERDGQTPAMAAAALGNIEMAQVLMGGKSQNVQAKDGNGNEALHFAARRGEPALIELFLAAGAKPCGESLRLAVSSGSVDSVKILMAAMPSDEAVGDPLAPVAVKALGGVADENRALRSRVRMSMMFAHERSEALDSPWLLRPAINGSMEMVKLAFACDGGLVENKKGATALSIAATDGVAAAVKFFIASGDLGAGAAEALRLAACGGKTDCVKALLAARGPDSSESLIDAARAAVAYGHFVCAKAIYKELSPELRCEVGPQILAGASASSKPKGKPEAAAALMLAKMAAPGASARQVSEALMAGIKQCNIELVDALFPLSDLGTNALVAMEMLSKSAEGAASGPEANLMSALVCSRALSMMEAAAVAGAISNDPQGSQKKKTSAPRL